MKSNRVTLRDIAELVGVHPSTVSRVLNPEKRGLVSSEIAALVDRAVDQLGYYPDRAAHGLRTNRSSTIGIVVSDIGDPTFPKIITGIQDIMNEHGFGCVVCSSDQQPERKRRIVEIVRKYQFDGLILLTTEREDPLISACQEDGTPVAVLARGEVPLSTPSVHLDDRTGVRKIMDHLTELGHRRIAVISGPQRLSGAFSRHQLVMSELTKRKLPIDPELIAASDTYSTVGGTELCNRFLASGHPFTAIVTAYDLLAIGCIEVLKQHGITCPNQISVVGYNDVGLSDKTDPPLTTVRFDQDELGATLARLLLPQLGISEPTFDYEHVEPSLIVRGSTAAAP